ncbi:hypothetical protein IAI10_10885 [Clostridium sp. 19966]|uniref:hypothetical protein n=1 Tax=Clostridium sp. 19966 TaxID=2768166 RepID=UPI0028E088FD|nr:hypothetical protein [Clostridium sp. 19966]MDT8717161.1 hypothetical protein [Clostridium sp. 19966]
MRKFRILTSLVLTFGIIIGQAVTANADGFYADQQATVQGYSAVGILVLQETLHADGYSYSNSGRVTDLWLTTDRCIFPNNVENEKTWKASYPTGQYAKGSFNNKIGIPSPWGAVGLGTSTQYMSILF